MKVGDLIRDDDGDYGVLVEFDRDHFEAQVVVYYAGMMSTMGDEEKYCWMYEDQVKVICEAG